MLPPKRLLAIALALSTVALTACGDDDDDGGGPAPEVAAPEDTVAAGATGEPVDCATPGETVTVDIGDFEFLPERVQVAACDEIVWNNTHTQPHTSTGNGDASWSTGNIAAAVESDPIAFDTPGEFAYMCALHPFMKGVVEVS